MNRRDFLISAAAGPSSLLSHSATAQIQRNDVSLQNVKTLDDRALRISDGVKLFRKKSKGNIAPVLRDEIRENPGAVFIIRAGIAAEREENRSWTPCPEQFERFGRRVGRLVFRKGVDKGVGTFIKPNLVSGLRGENALVQNQGGRVHPYFVAGLTDSLHDIGNSNVMTGARGSMSNEEFRKSGCMDYFNARNLPLIEANAQPFDQYKRSELQWHKNPDAMVARKFCTYKPVFSKGTSFINIAHAHTHKTGHTTLTLKNLQGIMPRGYGHICDAWVTMDQWRKQFKKDFNPDYRQAIEASYIRHGNMGYKFWDDGGFHKAYCSAGGYDAFTEALKAYEKSRGDEREKARERLYGTANSRLFWIEQWAQRMMDCVEVLPQPMVSMVEGVFTRGYFNGIMHTDFLTVGQSMVAVDAVTSWLMGHDPRELPYLRIANERGIGQNDIEKIPIYTLDEKGPVKVADYRDLTRHFFGICNMNLKELGPRFY